MGKALHYLKQAIKLSKNQNTRAQCDLAMSQKGIGRLAEAKQTLEETLKHSCRKCISDEIFFYEQLGLIMRAMAEAEKVEKVRKQLEQDSSSVLMLALKNASRIYAHSQGVDNGELFRSFPILLREAEASSDGKHSQLQAKAKLFQLIRDHKQSLDLLQEIEQINPQEANRAEHLKLCIENYVGMGDYMKASTFVDLLECTSHSTATLQLFEDEQYMLKVYLGAAHQALQ